MRALFLEIELERAWAVASIGPAFIAAFIRKHGHEAVFLKVPFNSAAEDIILQIESLEPDIIGVSLTMRQWLRARELIRDIRRRIDIPVIAGGLLPSFEPEAVLASGGFDMVCIGEGERPMLELLDRLEIKGGIGSKPIDNIMDQGDPRPRLGPVIADIDKSPFMARDLLNESHGVFHMVMRRGCPFSCRHCAALSLRNLYGPEYLRRRSVENVIAELIELRSSRECNYIIFLDDSFIDDSAWVKSFAEKYAKHIGVGFSVHARIESMRPEILEMLVEAGLKHVVYGVESGSERIRRVVLNRSMTDDRIVETFDRSKRAGTIVTADYMLGIPGETRDDIEMTLDLNDRLDPHDFGYFVFYPYPGTPLFHECRKNGMMPDDYMNRPANHRETILNLPHLSKDDILLYYQRFTEARIKTFIKKYSGPIDDDKTAEIESMVVQSADLG